MFLKCELESREFYFRSNEFSGAYYLAGYAVECALKACIAKQIQQYEFPDRKFILNSYTHDLDKLLNTSGLKSELFNEIEENHELNANWSIVKDWNIEIRYDYTISERRALDLIEAIDHNTNGILKWLRARW